MLLTWDICCTPNNASIQDKRIDSVETTLFWYNITWKWNISFIYRHNATLLIAAERGKNVEMRTDDHCDSSEGFEQVEAGDE